MPDEGRRSILKKLGGTAALGISTLAGCVGDGTSESNTFQIAATFGQEHMQVKLLERWGENLSERTDGSLSLEYVSLGGEGDHINATASGSITGHGAAMTALTQSYGTEYGFLEAPFVVEDWDHFQALMDEYVYGEGGLNDKLIANVNQRILGAAFRGFRGTTANEEVRTPSDVEGVKIRLPEFKTWVDSWKRIGVQATPVPYDELYQSLQTGVVAASEGPIAQFADSSLYEVQSYFSQTDHLLQTQNWVINEETWQGLDKSEQEAMQTALDEAIEWGNEQTRTRADELFQMVQDEHDVAVISSSDVDRDAFRSVAEPQLEKFFNDRWRPSQEDVQSLA